MASKRGPADKAEISSDTSASSAWPKSMVQSYNKQPSDNVCHLPPDSLKKANLTFYLSTAAATKGCTQKPFI
jgi:hypothetical protein